MATGFGDPRADLSSMTVREIAEELLAADARYPGCQLVLAGDGGATFRPSFIGAVSSTGGRQPEIVVVVEREE